MEGLPTDPDRFIRIDDRCRVHGLDDVYAAGDGTNFPVKQGGIATQQADAAATDIAHRLGAAVRPALQADPAGEAPHGRRVAAHAGGARRRRGEGEVSPDTLWWPPHKISGRYLAPWLYNEEGPAASSPEHGLDVEVALPRGGTSSRWRPTPTGPRESIDRRGEWRTGPGALDGADRGQNRARAARALPLPAGRRRLRGRRERGQHRGAGAARPRHLAHQLDASRRRRRRDAAVAARLRARRGGGRALGGGVGQPRVLPDHEAAPQPPARGRR